MPTRPARRSVANAWWLGARHGCRGRADGAGCEAGTVPPGTVQNENSDEHYRRAGGPIRVRAAAIGRASPRWSPRRSAAPFASSAGPAARAEWRRNSARTDRRRAHGLGSPARRAKSSPAALTGSAARPANAESVSGFVLRHDGSRNPAALAYRQTLLGSPGTDRTGVLPR
jgi:hypothetical protein